MCGLVGIAGMISHDMRTRIFRDMLDVCQTRGRDSTGVIIVDEDLEYDWVKQVGVPSILVDSRMYEMRIEKKQASVLIGHTRSKTIGEVSVKNAHPFDIKDAGICGVHNGTLRGYHNLDTHQHGKVDSEVLYGHLAINGVDETFKTVEGAYACVWWNDNEKTLNFIRNDERPLWFTWSEDMKTMFWASECWMFGAVSRKVKLWDGGEEKKVFRELPLSTLWMFRINPKAKGEDRFLTLAPPREIKPVEKVRRPYQYQDHNYDGAWERQENGTWSNRNKNLPVVGKENGTNAGKGGEVIDPFAQAKGKEVNGRGPPFNDPLPDVLLPTENQSTPLGDVDFLRRSIPTSGSSTAPLPSTSSSRNVISLPTSNSTRLRRDNRGGPSSQSAPSNSNTEVQTLRGVSLRVISGLKYITKNDTGEEFVEADFMDNTNGECCFCGHEITDLKEVGEIMTKNTFLCKPCLEPKKATA